MVGCEYLGADAVIGYCTNVHPGTTVDSVLQRIRGDCSQVRGRLDPRIAFGIGLWLSFRAVQNFKQPELTLQLKAACRESKFEIFSWNAFPYYDFHQLSYKEQVYSPNWSERNRLLYTLDILKLVENLSMSLNEVSISTLPLAARSARLSPTEIERATDFLIEFVIETHRLEEAKGLRVHLALEPEPFCHLETSHDAAQFFKNFLIPRGIPELKKQFHLTSVRAESVLLDKIRICYDTCHAAILFENPKEIMRNYDEVGIQIGKVQLSSAPVYYSNRLGSGESRALLQTLSKDSTYLHQVVGRTESFADLPEALSIWSRSDGLKVDPSGEYRVHFHIPIFLNQFGALSTTQDHILSLIDLAKQRRITSHWEVETYTWPALPRLWQVGEISERIAAEIQWFYQSASSLPSRGRVGPGLSK